MQLYAKQPADSEHINHERYIKQNHLILSLLSATGKWNTNKIQKHRIQEFVLSSMKVESSNREQRYQAAPMFGDKKSLPKKKSRFRKNSTSLVFQQKEPRCQKGRQCQARIASRPGTHKAITLVITFCLHKVFLEFLKEHLINSSWIAINNVRQPMQFSEVFLTQ